MKLAGRDAGQRCVIIDVIDSHTVVIDGETRRRKCNVRHLEPLDKKISIAKNASDAEVAKAMAELGFLPKEKKAKKEKAQAKKTRTRVAKQKPVKAAKPAKAEKPKAEKKAADKKE